jgi:hypothetical protein
LESEISEQDVPKLDLTHDVDAEVPVDEEVTFHFGLHQEKSVDDCGEHPFAVVSIVL